MSPFVLKFIIVVLFFGVLASLSSGLWFLLKDQQDSKRTLYALGTRITLAGLLLIAITYGVLSGILTIQAPGWGNALQNVDEQEQTDPYHIDEVPVPTGGFKAKMIVRFEVTSTVPDQHDRQHDCTDANMQAVESSQHKERRAVYTGLQCQPKIVVCVHIFVRLNDYEDQTEADGNGQPFSHA